MEIIYFKKSFKKMIIYTGSLQMNQSGTQYQCNTEETRYITQAGY